jgi:SAM-dependent methyltransferase
MPEKPGWLESVQAGYDADPEAEWKRLAGRVQNRIEHLVTTRVIEEALPLPSGKVRVLDAGGGPGRYTIALAEAGYRVTLLDLSPRHIELANQRINGLEPAARQRVEGAFAGSFTDLGIFDEDEFDAVLCLGGAISHVLDASARRTALDEFARVAVPGAPIIVSAGNLLSGLRGAVLWPAAWESSLKAWHNGGLGAIATANGAPYQELMPEQIVAMVEDAGLRITRVVGCQGIAAHLPPESMEALMEDESRWPSFREVLLETCDHPSIVGLSCHLLIVARTG